MTSAGNEGGRRRGLGEMEARVLLSAVNPSAPTPHSLPPTPHLPLPTPTQARSERLNEWDLWDVCSLSGPRRGLGWPGRLDVALLRLLAPPACVCCAAPGGRIPHASASLFGNPDARARVLPPPLPSRLLHVPARKKMARCVSKAGGPRLHVARPDSRCPEASFPLPDGPGAPRATGHAPRTAGPPPRELNAAERPRRGRD